MRGARHELCSSREAALNPARVRKSARDLCNAKGARRACGRYSLRPWVPCSMGPARFLGLVRKEPEGPPAAGLADVGEKL
jgi:hypothetical protein